MWPYYHSWQPWKCSFLDSKWPCWRMLLLGDAPSRLSTQRPSSRAGQRIIRARQQSIWLVFFIHCFPSLSYMGCAPPFYRSLYIANFFYIHALWLAVHILGDVPVHQQTLGGILGLLPLNRLAPQAFSLSLLEAQWLCGTCVDGSYSSQDINITCING
jgi:hypothetical protein